jgi:hypothetical protein
VDFDVRRVARVAVGLCLLTLATLVIIFSIAGVQKNNQINRLHHDGVKVDIIVNGCQGLLGGSGSNDAGYTCTGTFTLDGARHTESIPGDTFHAPGSSIQGVAVPGDPALLSPSAALAGEHTSGKVFLLPGILLVVLILSVVALVLRRQNLRRAAQTAN